MQLQNLKVEIGEDEKKNDIQNVALIIKEKLII